MPLGELEDEAVGKILLVGAEPHIKSALTDGMSGDNFKLDYANSGFEAGIQAESLHPDCVVIDFAMGRSEALMIAQNLRKNPEYNDVVQIGLLSDDDNASGFDRTVLNETFPQAVRYRPACRTDQDSGRSQETTRLRGAGGSCGHHWPPTRHDVINGCLLESREISRGTLFGHCSNAKIASDWTRAKETQFRRSPGRNCPFSNRS